MFEEVENEEGDEDAGRKAVDTQTKVDRICQYHRCRVAELLRKEDALGARKVRDIRTLIENVGDHPTKIMSKGCA